MIKITNTRTLHIVENESAFLGLHGEVQFTEGGRIASFDGQFKKLGEEEMNTYYGNFYFSENAEDNTVNKSINSIPSELHTHGCDLLEATVAELHEYAKGAEPEVIKA